MDHESPVSADLVLVALSAPRSRRRLPARVVRRGPGRRRAGRFVQLRKEQHRFEQCRRSSDKSKAAAKMSEPDLIEVDPEPTTHAV